jgi:asparagine synthase (glutamine-hydrolysing)
LKRNHQLSLISQLLPLLPPYLLKIYYRLRKLKLPWIIGDLPLVLSNSEKAQLQQDTIALYKKFCTFKKDHTQDIWPSNIDSFGEEWDCSPSHLNLELTYPLQDRRILEFLFQIPVEHFQSKGLKRGLIRNSMIGILPEKIRLRRDKKAYSPDYFKITTRGISKLKLLLDDEKSSKVFSKIIDVTKLKSQIGKLEVSGEYSEVEDVYYDVVDLCMAIVFIHWFINKDNPS